MKRIKIRIGKNATVILGVFLLLSIFLPFHLFSQEAHNHDHHHDHLKKDSNKKDSAINIINEFKREDGLGGGIIIQRHRNDLNTDKWIKEYIKNIQNTHNTLKLTKSSGCSNLDFEDGNFNSWTGQTGTNNGYPAGGWSNGIVAGRHTIVSAGADPYASAASPIPLPAPGGGAFSVKLGNNSSNYEAEQLIYTFNVQPQDTNFIYKYAVVLEDPAHSPVEQPYFDFQILDQGGNAISCSYQHYVSGGGLAGFYTSPTNSSVRVKPWTTVGINLSSYIGQNITIIATTADCSQGAHFGYAYLDFVCPTFATTPTLYCDDETSAVINAPTVEPGMSFVWSTGETTSSITINPQLYNNSSINCFIESPTSVGVCGFWYVFPIQVVSFDPDFGYTSSCLTTTFSDASTINYGTIQSWAWDFGDGSTSTSQNPTHTYAASGTYNVSLTVTSPDCGPKTITQQINLTGLGVTHTITNMQCFGDNDAIASVTATGAPPYSYVWTPNPPTGQGTNTISGLSAGTYVVVISDNSGCSSTDTCLITQPTEVDVQVTSTTNVSCYGGSNGSITVTAAGGILPYQYLWNDPAPAQTTATATGLTAGTWTVQVSDNNGCTASTSMLVSQPSQLNASIPNQTNVSCFGGADGSATVTASGGTGGTYSYLWNDPAPAQTTATAIDLSAGTWTVQVTDSNSCTTTASITITQPAVLTTFISAQTNVSCFGGTNGSLTANATGGTLPYSFAWSDAQITATASNLNAGNYIVIITDALNCTATTNATITQPTAITLSTTYTDVSCFGTNTGSINLTVSGGTLPYASFAWSNNATTEDNLNIAAGTYNVIVTDANGCTETTSATVSEPTLLTANINGSTNISCYGGNDGTASVIANGGTPPYTYIWATNPLNNSSTISNLSAGNSSVIVQDANACEASTTFALIEPLPLTITTSPNVTICNGGSTTLAVNAAGGTMPYFYFWNNQPGIASLTVNPLSTTSYITNAVDVNGCVSPTSTITVTVMPPVGVNATVLIDSICPGDFTDIFISAFNGNGGPYTLSIPDGTVITSPYTVQPQTTQQYVIQATDLCNSSALDTVTVFVYPTPPINIIADKYTGCVPLRVQFNETSLNIGQTYLWDFDSPDENNLSFSKNPVHIFDVAGSYDVSQTVTTVEGCKAHLTVPDMIIVYPLPEARFTYNPIDPSILNPLIEFTNLSSGYVENYWSFGDGDSSLDINPDHLYRNIGEYPVALIAISDKGCKDTIVEIIKIKDVYSFYAPTAFSPDNDGKNDMFFVFASGIDESSFNLFLYDRWGELIFQSTDLHKGWDGKVKGEMSQVGTYTWLSVFKDFMGNQKTEAGKVTIIR